MEFNALVAVPFELPSVPKVVALLLGELDADEPDLRKINQLISTDPALTVRVLRLANSVQFQMSGRIHCASEALALLSLAQVKALASEATTAAATRTVAAIALPQFWSYSLNVARVARALAGVTRQNPLAAYTCGLIHAVGELALHRIEELQPRIQALDTKVPPLDLRRARVERRELGYCYAQVGAAYARQWLFPQTVIDALEYQYAPFDNDVYEPLAGVIHLAAWRARAREAALSDRALAVTFPGAVGEVLGLDIDMVLQQDPIDWNAGAVPQARRARD